MGIQISASKAPADPANLAGWQLGEQVVGLSATSWGQLWTLLGYRVDTSEWPGGTEEPAELLRRIQVANHPQSLTIAAERWGAWHDAGYFEQRLIELATVAREAETMGGLVSWG